MNELYHRCKYFLLQNNSEKFKEEFEIWSTSFPSFTSETTLQKKEEYEVKLLNTSVKRSLIDVILYLIKEKNVKMGNQQRNALYTAYIKRNSAVFELMLKEGADVRAMTPRRMTMLQFLVQSEELECIKLIVQKHGKEILQNQGLIYLSMDISNWTRRHNMCEYLLQNGCDPNEPYKGTLLINKIFNPAYNVQTISERNIDLLLSYGWNVFLRCSLFPPFIISLIMDQARDDEFIVHVINKIDHEALWLTRDISGRTSLFWAIYNELFGTIKVLLEKGANIHQPDNLGETPFHMLCNYGFPDHRFKELCSLFLMYESNILLSSNNDYLFSSSSSSSSSLSSSSHDFHIIIKRLSED